MHPLPDGYCREVCRPNRPGPRKFSEADAARIICLVLEAGGTVAGIQARMNCGRILCEREEDLVRILAAIVGIASLLIPGMLALRAFVAASRVLAALRLASIARTGRLAQAIAAARDIAAKAPEFERLIAEASRFLR